MPSMVADNILKNLQDKKVILNKMLEVMKSQSDILASDEFSVSVYDSSIDEVDSYVDELSKLDDEMDVMLASDEVNTDKSRVLLRGNNEIKKELQEIDKLTIQINGLLSDNKNKTTEYLNSQYKDVSNQRKSVAGIKGYFQSMGGLGLDPNIMDSKV